MSQKSKSQELEARTIYLGGEITEDASEGMLLGLLEFEKESTTEPIQIIINSCGGDVDEALSIFDAIKLSPCPTVGVVYGAAFSAAAIILQACDTRLLTPRSRIMVHTGTTAVSRKHHLEAKEEFLEYDKLDTTLNDITFSRCTVDKDKLIKDQIFRRYYSAKEAIQIGLADGIISNRSESLEKYLKPKPYKRAS